MARRKLPEVVSIETEELVKQLGWFRWKGMRAEYDAIVSMLPWFSPKIRIEELEPGIVAHAEQLRQWEGRDPASWP